MVFSLFSLPVGANEGIILNRPLQGTTAKRDPAWQSISVMCIVDVVLGSGNLRIEVSHRLAIRAVTQCEGGRGSVATKP